MTINKRTSLYFLFKASLPIVLFFQLSGCASIIGTACINAEGRSCSKPPPPYVGVGGDLYILFTDKIPLFKKPLVLPLVLIDLPFSFVMDTLLLPITIPNYISYVKSKKSDKPKDNPKPEGATN